MIRLWVLWWVLSLLLSQSFGQLHSVKHGGQAATAQVVGAHDAHDAHEGQSHKHDGDGFLDLLFSEHGSASDCRLYDHLGNGHAVAPTLAASLPIVLPSARVAIFAGDALARWAALFDARGPPLTA